MMQPHIATLGTPHKWLVVPYEGPEHAVIEIGFAGRWQHAFLDHEDGQRIAMTRHEGRLPAGLLRVRAGEVVIASWNIPAQPREGPVRLARSRTLPTVLLTGAAGFAAHHCLEHLLSATTWDIVVTDSFRHKGKSDRIAEVIEGHSDWRARLRVITHDLTAPFTPQTMRRIGPVDYVIAMASQSHVDRSIDDPVPFVTNNVAVALSTMEYCRDAKPKAVVWVSTDEVYGPEPITDEGYPAPHYEWSPILPSNPYSASKACQEAIAISYWRTYGVPVVIINCMNLIGERQDPEKYLPMLIARIRDGLPVAVHGVPGHIGTRHYLHARNLADGIVYILRELRPAFFPAHVPAMERNGQVQGMPPWPVAEKPDRYNVVGPDRVSNLELAQAVAGIIGKKLDYKLVDFHGARPGHDPHYGLDPAKLTALGWVPPVPFAESLLRTVTWSLNHDEWLI